MDNNKMQIIDVAAGYAAKTGATVSVGSAGIAHVQQTILGMTVDQWTVIGIAGGIVVGLIGAGVSAFIKWMDYADKRAHRKKLLAIAEKIKALL